MPVSYKKATAWGKRKFAEGYASGRRSRMQWSEIAATVAETINFDRCNMKQNQLHTPYGRVSLFFVPCGECGNPMFVKEVGKVAVLLACDACGHESETDRLPFVETQFVTLEANHFNQIEGYDEPHTL